jgi:exodeoxyribonuclease VII small subunit
MKIEELSFEEAYTRLSETAARLEKGNLTLDESLAMYEEGVALARHCKELLEKAELRVEQTDPSPSSRIESQGQLFVDEDDDFI